MAVTSSGARGDIVEFSSIPEPGQLVEIRRRQWVVTEVSSGSLPSPVNGKQHLVGLSSLDEDSPGEEIQVIWQLEPGAKVLEKAGLPSITGWDDPDHLEAFLDAVNWGAITNADRSFLQAPFRSGIAIEDYQLDPLVRAIDMARANLLIADDVGLGKTIEAGLVILSLHLSIISPQEIFSVDYKISLYDNYRMKLKEYLKKNKIKVSDFAASIGCAQPTISGYLTGARPNPRPCIALKIVEATNNEVSLDDIYRPS